MLRLTKGTMKLSMYELYTKYPFQKQAESSLMLTWREDYLLGATTAVSWRWSKQEMDRARPPRSVIPYPFI